jgi:hypothetical protein
VVGARGERIFELAITDFSQFRYPLFRPAFLGDKWPTIDYYVELCGVANSSPYFLAQVKATQAAIQANAQMLDIKVEISKCERLFRLPGPTYLIGVHEPTSKAYVLSVHTKPVRGIYHIPLAYELTPPNLKLLYEEVRDYWKAGHTKPIRSHFQ